MILIIYLFFLEEWKYIRNRWFIYLQYIWIIIIRWNVEHTQTSE